MAAGLRISTSVFVDFGTDNLFLEERSLLLFAAGLVLWDLDFLVPEGYKVCGFWECLQKKSWQIQIQPDVSLSIFYENEKWIEVFLPFLVASVHTIDTWITLKKTFNSEKLNFLLSMRVKMLS